MSPGQWQSPGPDIAAAIGHSRDLTEEKGHRYFFRLMANPRGYYGPFAERVAQDKHDRWCTIGLDISYAHDMTPNVLKLLKAQNPATTVVGGCQRAAYLGTQFHA